MALYFLTCVCVFVVVIILYILFVGSVMEIHDETTKYSDLILKPLYCPSELSLTLLDMCQEPEGSKNQSMSQLKVTVLKLRGTQVILFCQMTHLYLIKLKTIKKIPSFNLSN